MITVNSDIILDQIVCVCVHKDRETRLDGKKEETEQL